MICRSVKRFEPPENIGEHQKLEICYAFAYLENLKQMRGPLSSRTGRAVRMIKTQHGGFVLGRQTALAWQSCCSGTWQTSSCRSFYRCRCIPRVDRQCDQRDDPQASKLRVHIEHTACVVRRKLVNQRQSPIPSWSHKRKSSRQRPIRYSSAPWSAFQLDEDHRKCAARRSWDLCRSLASRRPGLRQSRRQIQTCTWRMQSWSFHVWPQDRKDGKRVWLAVMEMTEVKGVGQAAW